MPDNELSLILLVHVLNKHLQKNSAFLAHSKLPLTTVLADFVSTLTNYEKAFDHPPQNSTLNASDLSEIIEKSELKTSFTINPENGGELVFSSPIKQIQSTLLNVVVESSVKYGKSLLGQLQGLKDEYHTNSLENESIVEPSEPVSEVSDQAQGSENETPEISANTISEGARKTESPLESGPAEEDEMEVDVENVEQDSTPIEPVQEASEIEPEITLNVETNESLEPEEIKEIDVEVHKSEDPQSEEVQDEEVQDKQEIEAEADQEEEEAEEEEEEAEEEADEAGEIEAETANLSEPQPEVEIEAENVENKEEKDEDEEVVNDEIIEHEEKEENITKPEGEAENSSSDDEEENSSSREGDDSVSDEIERSSRLLLEESERDQEEVDHIEKPQLADVDIDTEAETSDHGEKEEEEKEEEEDSKDDAKQGELEAVSIPNKETKEESVQDPESEHVETTNTETTVPELVGSEPLGEKPETLLTEEKDRENTTEENEEQPSQESQEIQEPEPEPAPKAKPQEKSKPVPPSTRRKRKIEETMQEPVQPETPKKPRKAKETSVPSRRKSTASEQTLTPAQKYKRFQNIAINFIKSIEAHRCSSPFLTAITAPEYTSVVKQPQDLKTIMKNVKKRHDLAVYTTVKELERDVMLMFTNCVMFNKSSIPLVKMAQEMKEDVRNTFKMFEDTEKGLA